jgi:hypothetical protein
MRNKRAASGQKRLVLCKILWSEKILSFAILFFIIDVSNSIAFI